MTESLQFIHADSAKTHGWRPVTDFSFARALPALAVQLGEMGGLATSLPLAFAKVAQDRYTLVVITGFADGRNQVVDSQGRWLLQVLPMELQCYPFTVQPLPTQALDGQGAAEAKRELGVCFNHQSGLYREAPDAAAGDVRFFTDEGQPHPAFKAITERLQRNIAMQRRTQRAVAALQQHQLLIPWQIQPREGHPDERLPQGLYRIDEPKLNALKGEALESLHQVHALALAYGQLLSMGRITVLHRLQDTHAARQQPAASTPDPSVVAQVFGSGQGDTIKFNF